MSISSKELKVDKPTKSVDQQDTLSNGEGVFEIQVADEAMKKRVLRKTDMIILPMVRLLLCSRKDRLAAKSL
jgi:hypothetical protein